MESPQALIAPLEKGYPLKKSAWMIRGFKKSSSDDRPGPGICGSKYVEDAKAARSVLIKASSDAGPELAGRAAIAAMESPKAMIAPLKGGVNKSSSDDRPGPGICDSKYVEDAKAARSVRVWDRVPIKQQG